mmetsp:Transcript_1414/g.6176  ORF Transcript_1414/g.6176 Transcript_1414/m.6176 type:complete len:201 (-) Transcript_1414:210-812(-)
MGIDHVVRDALGVGHRPAGRLPWLGEAAHSEQREVHHVRSNLIVGQGCQEPATAEAHVALDSEEIRDVPSVRIPRRRLEHPRAVLLVPHNAVAKVLVFALERLQAFHDFRAHEVDLDALGGFIHLEDGGLHLVAPLELVVLNVPHRAPSVQKLQDAVQADVLHVRLAILPLERSADLEQAHAAFRVGGLMLASFHVHEVI